MLVLDTAYMIYLKFEEYPNALQIALFLDNMVCTLNATCILGTSENKS